MSYLAVFYQVGRLILDGELWVQIIPLSPGPEQEISADVAEMKEDLGSEPPVCRSRVNTRDMNTSVKAPIATQRGDAKSGCWLNEVFQSRWSRF